MKTVSTLALAIALGLGGSMAAAPALAQKKGAPAAAKANYSPKLAANDKVVRAALDAKNYDAAKAALAVSEAEAKTDDDKMLLGQYYVNLGQGTKDDAALAKGLDLMLGSGKADAALAPKLYAARGTLAYQAKDYDKAISTLTEAKKLNSDNPDVVPVLVESLNAKGQPLLALQTLNQGIDASLAANQPVPANWYQRGFSIGYAVKPNAPDYAGVSAQATELDRKWLKADPSGTVWHDVLLVYSEAHRGDAELANDVRRLLYQTGGLKSANDYLEYAEATYLKYPGEAKTVLDDGVKKGAFTFASNRNASEINGIITPKIPADKASLATSDKAARTAANGRIALSTADAYLGYGENAKAIDLYKLALQKGGVDANVVNTRLGIALVRSGDKAGAKAAFAAVTGPRKDLADFWTIYVDQPAAAA